MSVNGKKIAFLVAAEGVEQVELTEPWAAVEKAGGQPVLVVGGDQKQVQAFNHLDQGDTFDADVPVSEARVGDYAGLVLPGGVANPDQLRMDAPAVDFLRHWVEAGKPIAAICHGPWTLVEADVVRGRTLTSWPSLQTDLRNAGAEWVDEPLQVCTAGPATIVTSRKPDDLEAFCSALVDVFAGNEVRA